ncbi:hypothetical protein K1719_000411 [Acacia pycnantha]|nr:hypothetical protein K1719_000411 [Acacia pycnantha]
MEPRSEYYGNSDVATWECVALMVNHRQLKKTWMRAFIDFDFKDMDILVFLDFDFTGVADFDMFLIMDDLKQEERQRSFETENSRYLQIIEEKDKILEELQNEVLCLQQESRRGEFDHEKKLDLEKLMHQAALLGHQFSTSWVSFSSQLAEKQAEINLVQDACDKITAAEIIAILETEEEKLMIIELEDDIRDLEHKLKLQEER